MAGRKPCLALIRVGDDPASISYVRKKEKTAAEIGVSGRVLSQTTVNGTDYVLREVTIPPGELR